MNVPEPIYHNFSDPREQAVQPTHPQDAIDLMVDHLFQPARRFEELTEDQMALLDATDALDRLADRLGSYKRVLSVLRTVAAIHGESL